MNGGIYVHIPFCKSKCYYCSFVSGCDMTQVTLYLNGLKREIYAKRNNDLIYDTIYLGGGTPSVLPRGAIFNIISDIKKNYKIAKDCSITVEANPDSVSAEFIVECKESGVNRLSLGLQTDDDKILRKLNRPHNYRQFLFAVDLARINGITNISADLMTGLPGQTMNGFIKTVENVAALPLTHISLYALKIEEGTAFYERGVMIDEDLQADFYEKGVQILSNAGFERYEVSNFCKNGFESRHNLKYWNHSPYLGFGAAAHSFVNNTRSFNTSNISKYILGDFLESKETLTQKDLIEEYIMLSLRTKSGINTQFLKSEYGCDILKEKELQIFELKSINALVVGQNSIKLTDSAFYIMNTIILKLI